MPWVCSIPMPPPARNSQEPDPGGTAPWKRIFLLVVVIVFSVGAFANVTLEAMYEPGIRALRVRPDGHLSTVTETEVGAMQGRYWVASIVHDIAWGGVVVVPDLLLIDESRFHNLADVEVRVEDYDPMLTPEMIDSLDGLPTVRGVGNIIGLSDFVPFAVVWGEEGAPVPVLRLWFSEDEMFLIDDRVFVDADR